MQKLTFISISKILILSQRRKLRLLAVARILANTLDILGLAGLAVLATSFSALSTGSAQSSPIHIPTLGEVYITEFEAVIMATLVAATFLIKSFFSIWLNLRTSLTVASLEVGFAEQLTRNYFSTQTSLQGTLDETVSKFQNSILYSTSAISTFLNSRMTVIAEGSLIIGLIAIFLIINPLATIAILIYLVLVVLAMNRLVDHRLKKNSLGTLQGTELALNTSRELFGVRREVEVAGQLEKWLSRIVLGKEKSAIGNGLIYTLSALPRYVLETSLVLGIFGFLAAVVVFSDLASQSVTIGVFLAGGLRLVASMLPIQAAYQSMVGTSTVANAAFQKILTLKGIPRLSHEQTVFSSTSSNTSLKFDQVTFTFPGNTEPTLNNVSFEVPARSKTAIVGPSGAGKTTTFELATGFRLPSEGQVTISGIPARTILENSPGVIGIVPQRPHLITGSLSENVSLVDDPSTDKERVQVSLELAGLGDFINPLRLGLEGMITPDSGSLSGGEIQRLGLARALYRDPKILFLDEATSALDAETESKVNQTLDKLRGNMTIVLIAHRLSTVMNADNIIYLDKGRVVAQGTFQELKAKVPDFAKAVELMDLRD